MYDRATLCPLPPLAEFLPEPATQTCTPVVMVIEDEPRLSDAIRELCDCLHIRIQPVRDADAFPELLREHIPIALLARLDGVEQDGCHVMMRVADYDRTLPIMMVTGPDPALIGAAEAVQDLWGLSAVLMVCDLPGPGELANFLCHAARDGGWLAATERHPEMAPAL